MGKLGNLWFDVNLRNNTKQQAEQIRSSLLTKLKIDYEPASLQSMINGIRARLATEQFAIKIDARVTNSAGLAQANILQKNIVSSTREATTAIRAQNDAHLRLTASIRNGISATTRAAESMAVLYSVYKGGQLLNNIIEIGGQLERQRISISAILGDTAKANVLFSQIKDLAVKSPFGVVELDQYTKQLSAYGFQYNELYDMTKRLADISAGAGQDIGRLTLALGHVRSATYLTGITLRQFSMNNIPMLKMLADYYTELEGKIVSTAEVQKRISKRQVSYEDVIEQIRRLTDEGGMFYNMQEKISESLSAKFKNLKDSLDIMYGEIAESGLGTILKSIAISLTKMTRNWTSLAAVLGAVAGVLAVYKLGMLAINRGLMVASGSTAYFTGWTKSLTAAQIQQLAIAKQITREDLLLAVATGQISKQQALLAAATLGVSKAQLAQIGTTNGLKLAWAGLGSAVKTAILPMLTNPLTWITVAIGLVTKLWADHSAFIDRVEERTKEFKDEVSSQIKDLKQEAEELTKNPPKNNAERKKQIDEMRQTLADSNNYTKSLDEQLQKTKDQKEQWELLRKAIVDAEKEAENIKTYTDIAGKAAKIKVSPVSYEKDGPFAGYSMNLFTSRSTQGRLGDIEEEEQKLRKLIASTQLYEDALQNVIKAKIQSLDVSEREKDVLLNSGLETQIEALVKAGVWDEVREKIVSIEPEFDKVGKKMKGVAEEVNDQWEKIALYHLPALADNIAKQMGTTRDGLAKLFREQPEMFRGIFYAMIKILGVESPAIIEKMKKFWVDMFYGSLPGFLKDALIGHLDINKELANLKANTGDPKSGGSGKKTDQQLKEAKERLNEYKSFLSEYKKYAKTYDKDSAIIKVESFFPQLKGKGAKLVDDYVEKLKSLRNSLKATTTERKKFQTEIDKLIADTNYERFTEEEKKRSAIMKEQSDLLEKQWELYKKLYNETSDHDFASLAFDTDKIFHTEASWNETAKALLRKFNKGLEEEGVIPLNFQWSLTKEEFEQSLKNAEGATISWLVDLAERIKKMMVSNYTNMLEEAAKSLVQTETSEARINRLYNERAEILRKLNNERNPELKKGFQALLGKKDFEIFQASHDWTNVFGNLKNLPLDSIKRMISAMNEFKSGQKMSIEEQKIWKEAMDKLLEQQALLDPTGTLVEILKTIKTIRTNVNDKRDNYNNAKSEESSAKEEYEANPTEENRTKYDNASKKRAKAEKELNDAEKELSDTTTKAQTALGKFAESVSTIGSALSKLGSSIGGKTGDVISGFGSMFGSLGTGIDAIKGTDWAAKGITGTIGKVSAVLTVASAMIEFNTALSKMLPNEEKLYEHYARKAREINKLRRAYEDLQITEQKNQTKANQWVFSNDLIALRDAYEENGRVAEAYYKTLYEGQEQYQRKAAGIKKALVPILTAITAIVAVVAGIFTAGAGTAAIAGIGSAVIGALTTVAVTSAVAIATGAAIVAGLGYAVGQIIQAGLDELTYKDGQVSARDNLYIQTKHRTAFRGEKVQNLEDWVRTKLGKELFDEQGLINIDVAQKALELWGDKFVGDTKDTIERLIELREQYDEWLEQIHDYVDQRFSSLGDNMADAIWDWVASGEDALDRFQDYASNTFKEVAKDAVKSFLKVQILDSFKDQLENLFKLYSMGGINELGLMSAIASLSGDIAVAFKDVLPVAQALAETINNAFSSQGYDLFNDDTSSDSRNLIQGEFTEQETGLLLSYINAIRADDSVIRYDVSSIRQMLELQFMSNNVIAQAQLEQQQQIADNTLRTANAMDSLMELLILARTTKNYGFFVQ